MKSACARAYVMSPEVAQIRKIGETTKPSFYFPVSSVVAYCFSATSTAVHACFRRLVYRLELGIGADNIY